jgi:hypothetical protein
MSRSIGRLDLVFACIVALALSSCSRLIDNRATQCDRDEDCARFGSATCDVSTRICVASSGVLEEDANMALVAGGAGTLVAGAGGSGIVSVDASSEGALASDPCRVTGKPRLDIAGDITANFILTCEKDYLLKGVVFVKPGVTLTIQKGTTILGHNSKTEPSVLVVQPGAKIIAVGTADDPIVFTSTLPSDLRKPGDWGGVILLGNAPINIHDDDGGIVRGKIEGITAGGEYGGSDENDSSGVMKYVRIEYGGVAIAPNNEVNGLTFGGVGRGTIIDYIEVRQSADDCFEFFGGTVNAKHLICQYNGDDGFDWDNGYHGKLQFLVLQQDPRVADETNGFEGDNNPAATEDAPLSEPTIYNATLCGKNVEVDKQQYGMLLRRATRGHIFNTIATGFEAGVDVRDRGTAVDLKSSIFFGNLVKDLAYEEDGSNTDTQKDDDLGFNEVTWFNDPANMNAVADPGLSCFDPVSPRFQPAVALLTNAATPPDDGFFDHSASFIGAFRDAKDKWTSGAWVVFSDQ